MSVGETDREPEVTGVTKPILWLIEKVVALAVIHESVDGEPVCTEEGEADRVHVGASGAAVTVTIVLQVIEPPRPVAVPVYVVVSVGDTDREPAEIGVTAPTL